MKHAIEITDLAKDYGSFQLKQVNITLPAGYIMGFIGENGAGKTTTIKAMLGLIHCDQGEIRLLGKRLEPGDKKIREQIGVVMDESGFPDDATLENIDSIMKGCYQTWDSIRFRQYAGRFHLPAGQKVKTFSKGLRMKLSIAAALSHDSRLLILDEVTGGLDPVVREEILDLFLEFMQDENHSIFFSSHILSDLEKVCDYVTLIHQGRILFSENKDTLLEKYGVVKCAASDFASIDDDAVISSRKNEFGMEALVKKDQVPSAFVVDEASIEDIMVYFVKEEEK